MADAAGELYFLGEVDPFTQAPSPFVKIGLVRPNETRTTEARMSEHQTGNPRRIVELHVVRTPNVDEVETAMHAMFATHRIGGEWFRFEGDLLDTAHARAEALAAAMIGAQDHFIAAAALADQPSSGPKRTASAELLELVRHLARAKITLKAITDAQKRITATLLIHHEAGVDLSGTLDVQRKVIKPRFDRRACAAAHPDAVEPFIVRAMKVGGSFVATRPTPLGITSADVPSAVVGLTDAVDLIASRAKVEEIFELHGTYLELLQHQGQWVFEQLLVERRLRAECGTSPGIEDVCTWDRKPSENETFDEKSFRVTHPDLHAVFTTAEKVQIVPVVARDRGYRL